MIYLCSMILFYACILNRNQLIKVHFYKSSLYPHLPKLKGKNKIFGRLPEVKPKFPSIAIIRFGNKVTVCMCKINFFFILLLQFLTRKVMS